MTIEITRETIRLFAGSHTFYSYFRVLDFKMVGFNGKPLCFCGSDLQTGSQFLHVDDNVRRPVVQSKISTFTVTSCVQYLFHIVFNII